MAIIATLVMSAFFYTPAAQPVPAPEEQNSALRGAMSLSSEWAPAAFDDDEYSSSPRADKEFLSDVESELGTHFLENNKERIAMIMQTLRPTFESVDKNEYKKLGATAVRYVLHRLFVARHGWLMKGLDPAGQNFDSASPVQVLAGKTSMQVQGIFEKRLAAQGFGLHELAVFASLLETLISDETSEHLQVLFEKLHIKHDALLSEAEATNVIELYMTEYILGLYVQSTKRSELMTLRDQMPTVYSFWNETQKLVREVQKEVLGLREKNTFADVSSVLVRIGERFGKWQNAECLQMKQKLINLETDEKGCVPLSNFYKGAVHSGGADWQFGESLDYLKTNGIIDNNDPENPTVMVANYMNGPANCIATSHYYAVCCIDECESLLGHIEKRVSGSVATPDELISLVGALASSTVAGNRTLPPTQVHRLFKIAEKHGGYVPLHGRLFMQWMHMVYPRECAYPHLAGTTKPVTPDAWIESTDQDPSASKEEMKKFVNAPARNRTSQSGQGQCGRWVDEEELFIGGQTAHRRNLHELEADPQTWLMASSVALLCVLAATTLAVISAAKSVKNKLCGRGSWMQEQPRLMLV